jgi:putative CocE/NonD family hydrolase
MSHSPIGSAIRVVAGLPSGARSPAVFGVRVLHDVLTPMRDGVSLAMDVLRPTAPGRFPVILLRTPYNKVAARASPFVEELVRRGYIVAVQDCRGRFNSDGVFDPYRQEPADGCDTVDWVASQDWCDGNVGMMGGSYCGQTQWLAASQAPKALKAIVPTASPPGSAFLNEPFWGGIMLMAAPEWMFAMGRRSEQIPALRDLYTADHAYLEALPLADVAKAAGTSSPWWNEWLSHPTYDEYWQSHGYEQHWPQMAVPALNITGWWDMNFLGAPRNFIGMRRESGADHARQGQRLVIGPWPHRVNQARVLSGVDFGPSAISDLNGYTLWFLDYWVRGARGNGLHQDARVHVFVVGANEWWEADEWPLPGTQPTPFYFHSRGRANTHRGDGTLSRERPGRESSDTYESDPLDPVRVLWNLHEGPVDERPVSARPDVLCYTSPVLRESLDVVGPVSAVLYGSSTACDCDWHVRLVDVYPDGAARFLCHGALRARFREGYDRAVFLEPGRIERFEIDMTATGVRLFAGHRIRIEVSSSWFPRFERNPQTDAPNWMTDTRTPVIARQRIFHDGDGHESHVSLPLIRSNEH